MLFSLIFYFCQRITHLLRSLVLHPHIFLGLSPFHLRFFNIFLRLPCQFFFILYIYFLSYNFFFFSRLFPLPRSSHPNLEQLPLLPCLQCLPPLSLSGRTAGPGSLRSCRPFNLNALCPRHSSPSLTP